MSYKNIPVCKELYLTIPSDTMSIDAYKKTYGIDLREFLSLQTNMILLKNVRNTKVFIVADVDITSYPSVGLVNNIDEQGWVEGSDDGYLTLSNLSNNQNYGFGIQFVIQKNSPLAIDSIMVADASL